MPSGCSCRTSPASPVFVDLASMRSAVQRMGGDPSRINPLVPVDLVIDHSVQVDYFGSRDALGLNLSGNSKGTRRGMLCLDGPSRPFKTRGSCLRVSASFTKSTWNIC